MSEDESYLSDDDRALTEAQICTVMPVPEDRVVEAAIQAVEENPDNAPIRTVEPGLGIDPHGPMEMAILTERKWKPGRTLRVKFLDGNREVQRKVEEVAHQWEDHANVKLDFVEDGDAEVRISFQRPGSWSYLGTVALVIPPTDPTMNFGWLKPNSPDDEYSRVVLHEFGHAFSCIHEHQHPEAGIPWDREKVYRYYRITNGWDRDKVDRNVLDRYSADVTQFSSFDPTSIMQYAVPNELTLGDFSIGWNRVLSSTDKSFIGTIYPDDRPDAPQLLPGSVLEADIGVHGEEDRFWFDVEGDTPRRFALETRGETDVVMALYGPDSDTQLLAFDDDSGQFLNARIVKTLAPGRYRVRVRHYSSWGTGTYSIRLQPVT